MEDKGWSRLDGVSPYWGRFRIGNAMVIDRRYALFAKRTFKGP